MIIGLVLLAIVAVAIFFGATSRFFRRIGIANWIAFLIVVTLVVGAVVPVIRIGTMFSMSLGGFAFPLILSVIMMILIGANSNLAKAAIALIAVASVTVATRMLIMPDSTGMRILSAVIVGMLGGAVAYLIGQTRLGTLASALGGVVLGDVIVSLVYRFVTGTTGNSVLLGQNGIFDAVIIAAVFGVVLAEIVFWARRGAATRRVGSTALNTESAEDHAFAPTVIAPSEEDDLFDDYFNDDI